MESVRLTPGVLTVLELFLADLTEPHYGYSIMDVTGFSSGKTYQILARLTAAGWLERHHDTRSSRGGAPPVTYTVPPSAVPTIRRAVADAVERRDRGTTRRAHGPLLRPSNPLIRWAARA
ncbi:hypothetical protein [Gordonia polyisoprenivorans]|uniref:hypothetical protein n=1 Tax=Gordonia polyisoprenivorans TaxID=84595 RepID=UPI000694112D|nr:hypothetical protein [Gordonia polyisoprenivorans]